MRIKTETMKKIIFTLTTVLFLALINLQAQSLKEVLNKHFEAVGQEKLVSAQTYTFKAKINQMGLELPMQMKMKQPNKVRWEMDMQGQKMIQAFDGDKGWMIAPWISPNPQELAGDQLKQAMEQADIEGELYNFVEKGHLAELIGKVMVDDTETYRIKLTTKNGDIKNYYIDTGSYLILKVNAKIFAMGQEVEVEQKMGDYKNINGILMATKLESITPMGAISIIME